MLSHEEFERFKSSLPPSPKPKSTGEPLEDQYYDFSMAEKPPFNNNMQGFLSPVGTGHTTRNVIEFTWGEPSIELVAKSGPEIVAVANR